MEEELQNINSEVETMKKSLKYNADLLMQNCVRIKYMEADKIAAVNKVTNRLGAEKALL